MNRNNRWKSYMCRLVEHVTLFLVLNDLTVLEKMNIAAVVSWCLQSAYLFPIISQVILDKI